MTIIVALLVFGVIVLFHEFGHFIIAKASGVKVHEFAIGMGPKLASIQGKETLYSIRILPIGGYVKMLGENEESDDERSFGNKSIFKRISIIAAGPIMNFILAVILFAVIFMSTGTPSTTVKEAMEGYPAQQAGIIQGDKIVEIEGEKISEWNDITSHIGPSAGEELEISIERDGKLLRKVVVPKDEDGRGMIGIVPGNEKNIFHSIKYSVQRTMWILSQMIGFLVSLIGGKAASSEVVGPVGIINVVGEAAKIGLLNVLSLAAVISINLGLLNLLPIPALDGSRILFLIAELIRGKKLDQEKEGFIHFIGFAILIAFMIFITYKDVLQLLKDK